jgi:tyrosyl-tRNA synthetase
VVRANAERVLGQFERILSPERLEVRYNSEWLERMSMEDVLRMTASYTVARMLERDDFAKRFAEQRPISIMEFMYPLLQAMDSVAVEADIELGGHDQLFNLLVGRDLQREYGQEPQIVLTMPLLIGLDGTRAMGQSLGNYVSIEEPAEEMFGKLMSIPDHLIPQYLTLCTDLGPGEVAGVEWGLADGSLPPMEAKRHMAREVVRLYHGEEGAERAQRDFDLKFREHEVPPDIPEHPIPREALREGLVVLARLLPAVGLADSRSEGRRLIEGGGVRLNGEPLGDPGAELPVEDLVGAVLSVGRRRFVRLSPPGP